MPHWIDISFYYRSPTNRERPYRVHRFIPCCQLPELSTGMVEVRDARVMLARAEAFRRVLFSGC